MVTKEFQDKIQKSIEENYQSYLRYKSRYEQYADCKSFKTKTQQKDVLEYISRAFEDLATADQELLILPMHYALENGNQEEHDKLSNIYYHFADYPYSFTDKKQNFVREYCPHFDELINLKNIWLKVKSLPIEPKKTKEENLIEKKEAELKKIDYSKITDMKVWEEAINNLINEIDKMITPRYEKLKQNKELNLDEKTIELMKKAELLDIKFNVVKALNFDINSVKIECYTSMYKEWVINNNLLLKIEDILAGGYNIQRLHYRTLVKVVKK